MEDHDFWKADTCTPTGGDRRGPKDHALVEDRRRDVRPPWDGPWVLEALVG